MTWVCTREPPTARLRLADSPSSRAILGGGWWPAPRDPVVELCGLVIALTAQRGGVIERITLQPAAWYRHPCRIGVGGATVRLGWFTTPGAALVIVTGPRDRLRRLARYGDDVAVWETEGRHLQPDRQLTAPVQI